MAQIAREVDCIRGNVMQIDMSNVQQRFNETISRLLDFAGVEASNHQTLLEEIYAVQHHELQVFQEHVTRGKYNKTALREIIMNEHEIMLQLNVYRRELACN
jgi:hypothetical protein